MRVGWTRRALARVNAIAAYGAADDPKAALSLLDRLEAAVARLAESPGIGRPGRVPGTRELVVRGTPYLVPYRVRDDVVEILTVFHTSRRPPPG